MTDADNDGKRLLSLRVLVKVAAKDTDTARVLGGNLVRQIEANIPGQYEVVGVSLESDNAEVEGKQALKAAKQAEEVKDKGPTGATTLKT